MLSPLLGTKLQVELMGHFASVFGASVSLFNLLRLNEVHSLIHDNHPVIVGIILIMCFNATSIEAVPALHSSRTLSGHDELG